ncbi:MAG: hypothetical protein ACYDB1_01270 [Acidiferrobacteraceae bacterium]
MSEIVAIKIGNRRFRVSKTLLPKDYGTINFPRKHICLDSRQLVNEEADTLLHEILHGVWEHRKLPDRAYEEATIRALASGLFEVFRDNPGLLSHLNKLVKASR